MVSKRAIVVALVLFWAVLFAWSFLASAGIDGPRNLETGLRRLDVLAAYQFVAFGLAVIAALLGVVWRRQAAWTMLIGLGPLAVTVLLVATIVVAAMVLRDRPVPEPPGTPTAPAAPAAVNDGS